MPSNSENINFQPQSAVIPDSYLADSGLGYSASRGYGWITQQSLGSSTPTPVNVSNTARDRNAVSDQRLDTLVHMQLGQAAAWEYDLDNGTYEVTVGVGDPSYINSSHIINVEGVETIANFQPTNSQKFATGTATVEVSDGKLTVDALGGNNTKIDYIEFAPVVTDDLIAQINFQPQSAVIPDSYLADSGLGYSASRGYGWITQQSLGSSTPTPVNVSNTARDRNAVSDQRLDTLVHMQQSQAAAWEYDLDNGTYEVTVGVGDPSYINSSHIINVEGVETIANFQPTNSQKFATGTATVEVSDGKLTVDALGGNNTKIDYIQITDASDDPPTPDGNPEIEVENLDGVPFSDRLAFSRIGSLNNPPPNGVHDLVTLRVNNTGDAPLEISDLSINGPWQIENTAAPTAIAAGGSLDLPIRFTATSGDVVNGSLTIGSNDADEPQTEVELSGFWQSRSEGGQEPNIQEIAEVFGYDTEIVGSSQRLNQQGLVQAVGEEVLSPYWQTADPSQPVSVRQLAAYHSYPAVARVFWHPKDSSQTNTIFVHEDQDGQSLLPRLNNSDAPAAGTFNSSGTFGFKIDPEWSDPNRNNQQVDLNNGSPGPAGHHVRFWPARDTEGESIDDTYLMVMDYSGINYDYNDNVYLVSNVTPEPQEALYRIDVGSDSSYTDGDGNVWSSDTGLFEPSDLAVAESKNLPIANTEDDLLYQTYRGKIDGSPPQDQRVLSFELPVDTSEELNVRLHFAEIYWGIDGRPGQGRRVFDVAIEGETVSDNFDIITEATGALNATVIQIGGVQVDDGVLNLEFDPETDFANIAAIEVLQPLG